MSASALPGFCTQEDVTWWLEEAGLIPLRPLRERYPAAYGDLHEALEPEELDGTASTAPPPPQEKDFLVSAARRHGFAPPGRYEIEILPRDIRPFRTEKTCGITFYVRILGGDHHDTECRLRFLEQGPDALVRRDLRVLGQWGKALGVGRQRDSIGYVIALGRAGQTHHVWLDIGHTSMPGGCIQLFAQAVEVGGPRDG